MPRSKEWTLNKPGIQLTGTSVTQNGKSKEPRHWTWSFLRRVRELSVMLQYWGTSSLSLFHLGAHSQLFRTETHTFFLTAPSMAHFFLQKYDSWEQRKRERSCPTTSARKQGDLTYFSLTFPNPEAPFPALLFNFLLKSHGPRRCD